MGETVVSGYCGVCGRQSRFQKQGNSNVLHLLLSVFTLGFWIPVWIVLAMKSGTKPLRCMACGTPKKLARPRAPTPLPPTDQ